MRIALALKQLTVEKVAINNALPFKAARRDATVKLKSFRVTAAKTNPMPFHLDLLWGHANAV